MAFCLYMYNKLKSQGTMTFVSGQASRHRPLLAETGDFHRGREAEAREQKQTDSPPLNSFFTGLFSGRTTWQKNKNINQKFSKVHVSQSLQSAKEFSCYTSNIIMCLVICV